MATVLMNAWSNYLNLLLTNLKTNPASPADNVMKHCDYCNKILCTHFLCPVERWLTKQLACIRSDTPLLRLIAVLALTSMMMSLIVRYSIPFL